jgi:hypothetical protein
MGGCNCRGGKAKVLNNTNNQDILKVVKEIYDSVIDGKEINDFNDLDKVEILSAYSLLYPNASGQPTIDDALKKITEGLQFLKVNYQRIKR